MVVTFNWGFGYCSQGGGLDYGRNKNNRSFAGVLEQADGARCLVRCGEGRVLRTAGIEWSR